LHKSLEPGGHYDVDVDTVCYSCRALEAVKREEQRQHEKDKVRPGGFAYEDGRIYTVVETHREGV